MNIKNTIKGLRKGKNRKIYSLIIFFYRFIQANIFYVLYIIYMPFPLQDKVVASAFSGRKYAGNSKYIIEEIHKLNPELKIVWITDNDYSNNIPEYITVVNGFHGFGIIQKYLEYISAKVWIDTHFLYGIYKKRNTQLFIETWHGGLGIKKIGFDSDDFKKDIYQVLKLHDTVKLVDIFVSNSEHLSLIYRNAFHYNGKILKLGFPENDALIKKNNNQDNIRKHYQLKNNIKIMLYAPTFRDNFEMEGIIDLSPYNIEFVQLRNALKKRFGGDWVIFVRWHPIMEKIMKNYKDDNIINVTQYPDLQEIIKSCDAFISDYSSCIFDAALLGIPCFTYTIDLEIYCKTRGTYYTINELPFPNAKNMEQLTEKIEHFDEKQYKNNWNLFCNKVGLKETGNATKIIAKKICMYINDKISKQDLFME